jgi:hypothetical protein
MSSTELALFLHARPDAETGGRGCSSCNRLRQGLSVADAKLAIMTTQYYTASSIDGFIADPDNSLSRLFQFSEPGGTEDEFPRFIAKVGAIAMGSTTHEWIAQDTVFLPEPSKWRGVPDVLAGREGQAHPGRPVLQRPTTRSPRHGRTLSMPRARPPASSRRPSSTTRPGPGPLSVTRRSTATSHRHQRRTA